jgi:hypothetical protein
MTTAWKGNNWSLNHETTTMLDNDRSSEHLCEHLDDGPNKLVLTTKRQVVEEFAICAIWGQSASDEVEQAPDSHVWCEPCCRKFSWQVSCGATMDSTMHIHKHLDSQRHEDNMTAGGRPTHRGEKLKN